MGRGEVSRPLVARTWYHTMAEMCIDTLALYAKGTVCEFQHALSAVGQPPG